MSKIIKYRIKKCIKIELIYLFHFVNMNDKADLRNPI